MNGYALSLALIKTWKWTIFFKGKVRQSVYEPIVAHHPKTQHDVPSQGSNPESSALTMGPLGSLPIVRRSQELRQS